MLFVLLACCLAATAFASHSERFGTKFVDVPLRYKASVLDLYSLDLDQSEELSSGSGRERRAAQPQQRNWPSLFTFFEHKCKPSSEMKEKYEKTLQNLKQIQKVCRINLADREKRYSDCQKDHRESVNREKALKAKLKSCSAERKDLTMTWPREIAVTAKCRSTTESLATQFSDLREAFGVVVADNRVLVRDLEQCDENQEHCSENREECDYRCPSSTSGHSSDDSSSDSSRRVNRVRQENIPWGASKPYETHKATVKKTSRKKV